MSLDHLESSDSAYDVNLSTVIEGEITHMSDGSGGEMSALICAPPFQQRTKKKFELVFSGSNYIDSKNKKIK